MHHSAGPADLIPVHIESEGVKADDKEPRLLEAEAHVHVLIACKNTVKWRCGRQIRSTHAAVLVHMLPPQLASHCNFLVVVNPRVHQFCILD